VSNVTIEPASEQEVADTTAVMGGEDWEMWMNALSDARSALIRRTIGCLLLHRPEVTWAIYKNGTIGLAKNDLERAARNIDSLLKLNGGGRAFISVNKALVTQASSAIPGRPALHFDPVQADENAGYPRGLHRADPPLFTTQMYAGGTPKFDKAGRVRIDDWEMRPEIQSAVREIWPRVTTENLAAETDIAGYRTEFLKTFWLRSPGCKLRGGDGPASDDDLAVSDQLSAVSSSK
jgi:enoyl-[acyl-carrier protein] reductase/trans-2-enoyl-CoA reductase (NAD+)